MANNLHVSYTLYKPGQDYPAVIDKIKALGDWARIHPSYWYVNSRFSAQEAVNALLPAMDNNDSLYVVDATNNIASWHNIAPDVAALIKDRWSR